MNEAIQRFKEMVGKINSVVVVGSADNLNNLLSAAILHLAFIELGKTSILDMGSPDEKTRRFISALCGDINQSAQKERLVIRLDSKSIPISELQYEKDGDFFNIILETDGSLDPNKIKIDRTNAPVDLLMLVDPKESALESLCAKIAHKEVIKLSAKDRSVAVKVSEIVFALFDAVPNKLATPLLCLVAGQEKESGQNTSEFFEIKQKLLTAGADQQKINESRGELLGSSFWKLVGRALSRSEFEKRLGTLWSFLPSIDFQKTGQDASAITRVFEELRWLRPEANFVALLWEESPKNISAIIGSRDTAQLSLVAAQMQSRLSSSYFVLKGFETFSQAELKIRSHIQRAQ